MSNKQIPPIYRSIISSVIEASRTDFDEVGVEEAVLQELLRSWETKVAMSRVADFSADPRVGEIAKGFLPKTLTEIQSEAEAHAKENGVNGNGNGEGPSSSKKRKTEEGSPSEPADGAAAEGGAAKAEAGAGGADDDAINSDLDDSDDEAEDGEEEEGGDLIIALYEKVQRVKNKWKVTLKDGIVSVGGKEYLFAKCQGSCGSGEEMRVAPAE
ncbi:transcription factor TFIIA complex subunit Toa1 [Pseudohyphozyma bogoriensis]|nr:transcription factor TFIIA complex subunit Toa1 [Pseudohyphozyma bogoriensis]